MSGSARSLVAIALVQVVVVGLYGIVEHRRSAGVDRPLGTAPPHRVDARMPSLAVTRRDGIVDEFPSLRRRTLVHVWATWCPGCRAELPGFLEVPSRHPVDVVAVALDRRWEKVDAFLGTTNSESVVLAASEDVEKTLGVRTLPVTFLVEPDGRIVLRFDGARDWADAEFVRTYTVEKVDVP